jgi:hypothetical protein
VDSLRQIRRIGGQLVRRQMDDQPQLLLQRKFIDGIDDICFGILIEVSFVERNGSGVSIVLPGLLYLRSMCRRDPVRPKNFRQSIFRVSGTMTNQWTDFLIDWQAPSRAEKACSRKRR